MSDIRKRLVKGFGAIALGPLVTAAIQLGTVPLLLHAWGSTKYGDWLLLSAIPSYLALSDLGFGNASGSDMTYRVAAGDRQGALETFQSSWAVLTAVSVAVLVLTSSVVWWLPWQDWLILSTLSGRNASTVILLLGSYALLTQQNSIFESGFRCDGHFATGATWIPILRITETFLGALMGVLKGSFVWMAGTFLVVRTIGTLGYALLMTRKSPWLHLGFRHARWHVIRRLAKPAIGFVVFPLGQSLSLQGFTILIGILSGPITVTLFSTTRTLTRMNSQLAMTFGRAIWPELSSAFGSGNVSLARRLHRRACQASLTLSALTGLALWVLGPLVYRLWLHGEVTLDKPCLHMLLLVSVASSFWYTSSVVPMSSNLHQRVAIVFFAVTLISLLVAWLLMPCFSITGAAAALLISEIVMSWFVLSTALGQVRDTVREFAYAVFTSVPAPLWGRIAKQG